MDNRTRDDQHRLLRTYFSPGVVANVEKGTTRNESRGAFLRLVRYHAVRAMSYNVATMPAANIRSFNLAIRPVFHATISARIAANLTGFDSIAGIECADDFITWRTVGHWVECFTETFLASTPTQFTQSSVSSDPSAYGQSSSAATSVETSPKHVSSNALLPLKEALLLHFVYLPFPSSPSLADLDEYIGSIRNGTTRWCWRR